MKTLSDKWLEFSRNGWTYKEGIPNMEKCFTSGWLAYGEALGDEFELISIDEFLKLDLKNEDVRILRKRK